MNAQFCRTERILGGDAMRRLAASRVAVFGIGGVGSYVAEALARSGIGGLDLIDNDTVQLSNLNRQLFALHSTLGMYKTDAAAARIQDICPECRVRTWRMFVLPENIHQLDLSVYDYVVDAVDTVSAKLALAEQTAQLGVPLISAMGTGNKVDPSAFEITDIYQTSVCPLARVMRRELKKRGVPSLKVIYSRELPIPPVSDAGDDGTGKHPVPGSTAFVPPAVGLMIAGEVVRELTGVSSAYG